MWMERWETIYETQPDLVEIVTWNDYAESSYIGPQAPMIYSSECPPATNYSHDAYLELTRYFSTRWKTGAYPVIGREKLFIFYRTHSKNAVPMADPYNPNPVNNSQVIDDMLYVATMLYTSAMLTMNSGSNTSTVRAPTGFSIFSLGQDQGLQSAVLKRNGDVILSVVGDLPFSNHIVYRNFNVYSKFVQADQCVLAANTAT
ncbi:hypothetical protein PBRA_008335, partial [Plasmodiophora brassicae]